MPVCRAAILAHLARTVTSTPRVLSQKTPLAPVTKTKSKWHNTRSTAQAILRIDPPHTHTHTHLMPQSFCNVSCTHRQCNAALLISRYKRAVVSHFPAQTDPYRRVLESDQTLIYLDLRPVPFSYYCLGWCVKSSWLCSLVTEAVTSLFSWALPHRFLSAQVDDITTAERPGRAREETRGSQLEAFADKLECEIWTTKTLKRLQKPLVLFRPFVNESTLLHTFVMEVCTVCFQILFANKWKIYYSSHWYWMQFSWTQYIFIWDFMITLNACQYICLYTLYYT